MLGKAANCCRFFVNGARLVKIAKQEIAKNRFLKAPILLLIRKNLGKVREVVPVAGTQSGGWIFCCPC